MSTALRVPGSSANRSSLTALLLVLLGLGMSDPAAAQSSRTGTGEVISVRELTLKAGVNPADFERFVVQTFNPAWEGAVPGMKVYVAKGDRGARTGGYVLLIIFDSEKTRNVIVPVQGGGVAEAFRPILDGLLSGPYQKLITSYLESDPPFTDYVVLR